MWPASWLFGRTRDWLTGDDVSIRVLCEMPYRQLYSPQTPLPTTRLGLQSRNCKHSRREFWRMHFRPSWSVKTRDQLRELSERHAIGWLDMTSEVAFFPAGRLMLLKQRSLDQCTVKVKYCPDLKSVLLTQPAVHSNQCPGHPQPLLLTQVPGPQGRDWEW